MDHDLSELKAKLRRRLTKRVHLRDLVPLARKISGLDKDFSAWQIMFDHGIDRSRKEISEIKNQHRRRQAQLLFSIAIEHFDPIGALKLGRSSNKFGRQRSRRRLASFLFDRKKLEALRWWFHLYQEDERNPFGHSYLNALFAAEAYSEIQRAIESNVFSPGLAAAGKTELGYRTGNIGLMKTGLSEINEAPSGLPGNPLQWLTPISKRRPPGEIALEPELTKEFLPVLEGMKDNETISELNALLRPGIQTQSHPETAAEFTKQLQSYLVNGNWSDAARTANRVTPDLFDGLGLPRARILVGLYLDALAVDCQPIGSEYFKIIEKLIEDQQYKTALVLLVSGTYRYPDSLELVEFCESYSRKIDYEKLNTFIGNWKEVAQRNYVDRYALKSKRCFILGNGPSIRKMPLHLLDGEDVFVVNRGAAAAAHGLPKPRFCVSSDANIYQYWKEEIHALDVEALFLSGNGMRREQIFSQNMHVFGVTGQFYNDENLGLMPGTFHNGGSVITHAIQIAHFIGYRDINVLGVDLDYGGDALHFYGTTRREARSLSLHRSGGFGARTVSLSIGKLSIALRKLGTTVRNLGWGGNLDSIPRADFEATLSSK